MPTLALCSDSNGTNAYVTAAQIYGKLVADALGMTFTNYSVSGYTSGQISTTVSTAISAGADWIIACPGTNDFSNAVTSGAKIHDVIKTLCDNVGTMCDNAIAAGKSLTVMSPIFPRTVMQIHQIEAEMAMHRVCSQKGVDFIPLTTHMLNVFSNKQETDITLYYTGADWHGTALWHTMVSNLVLSRQHGATTPPAGPVTLLDLHGDGTDGATAFIDSSTYARTITAVGNVQIDTAQSVTGGASILFDGSGDSLTIPDTNDWAFGTDNFTIEMDVRYAATNSYLVVQRSGSGDYFIFWNNGTTTYFQIVSGASVLLSATWSWTPSTSTWYNIKLERIGTAFKFYVNGSAVGSTVTSSVAVPNYGANLSIGRDIYSGLGSHNGWIDNLKITRG